MPASISISKAVLDSCEWEAVALADMLEFYNIQVMYTETDRNRSGYLIRTPLIVNVVLVDVMMPETEASR